MACPCDSSRRFFRNSTPTPILRIGVITAILLSSTLACSKLGLGDTTPTAPSGPPASGSTIRWTAVGSSDVIGFGSSKVCLPFEDCNGNGYVFVGARQLRSRGFTVNLTSLGIPGAVISAGFGLLGRQYGRTDIAAEIIDGEGPFVPRDATLVTIFTGPNDVNVITTALGGGAGGSDPNAFIDAQVRAFGDDYATLLGAIRARAGSAQIVVLNVPNLGAMPFLAGTSLAQRRAAQRASVRMTTTVVNVLSNVTVVDVMCDARLYQAANLSSDGFHPNDAGYAVLAASVVNAVTSGAAPAPSSSCPQMTAVP
jgi:lysophospholipase L1-like esterase